MIAARISLNYTRFLTYMMSFYQKSKTVIQLKKPFWHVEMTAK